MQLVPDPAAVRGDPVGRIAAVILEQAQLGALRIGVDVVGDAVLAYLVVHRVQPLARALGGPGGELLDQRTPVRARRVRRLEELIEAVGGLRIFG